MRSEMSTAEGRLKLESERERGAERTREDEL